MKTQVLKTLSLLLALILTSCGGPQIEDPEWLEDVPEEKRAETYYFPDLEMYYIVNSGRYVYHTSTGWHYSYGVPFIYTSLNLAAVPHVNVSIGFGGPIVYHNHFVRLHPGKGHYKHGLFFHYRRQFHPGHHGHGHFKSFFKHSNGHGMFKGGQRIFKPRINHGRRHNPKGFGGGHGKMHKGKPGKGLGK